MTRANAQRFWTCVDQRGVADECWPWIKGTNGNGYGAFYVARQQFGAHRFAWMLEHGSIPIGLHVLHRCDNPPCCNPQHLFLGTHRENVADMVQKGRNKPIPTRSGSRNHNAKLSEDVVDLIRHRVAAGETQIALAREFGVSRLTMRMAVNSQTWRHVPALMQDTRKKDKRGRPSLTHGVANGMAKLTENDVRAIRALAASGRSQSMIGARFGIQQCQVSKIVLRQAWASVE